MMRLSAVSWYDLGTPERVVKTINELGIRPVWFAALQGVGNHRKSCQDKREDQDGREQSLHAGFISELMSAELEWVLPLAY